MQCPRTTAFQHVTRRQEGNTAIVTIAGDFPWRRVIRAVNTQASYTLEQNGRATPLTKIQNDIIDVMERHPNGLTRRRLNNELPNHKNRSIRCALESLSAVFGQTILQDDNSIAVPKPVAGKRAKTGSTLTLSG